MFVNDELMKDMYYFINNTLYEKNIISFKEYKSNESKIEGFYNGYKQS